MYLGKIGEKLAKKIKENAYVDVTGYNVTLREENIRKTMNSHGTEETEKPRGQIPVDPYDAILKIKDVISIDSSIEKSNILYEEKEMIKSKKILIKNIMFVLTFHTNIKT